MILYGVYAAPVPAYRIVYGTSIPYGVYAARTSIPYGLCAVSSTDILYAATLSPYTRTRRCPVLRAPIVQVLTARMVLPGAGGRRSSPETKSR
eukprot:3542068-Rhodomonas_salina.1